MAAIGTRWAAAGIALGLALAAPGLTGLARADAPDSETTATTAAAADPRGAATRPDTTRVASNSRDSRADRAPRAAAATEAASPRHSRAQDRVTADPRNPRSFAQRTAPQARVDTSVTDPGTRVPAAELITPPGPIASTRLARAPAATPAALPDAPIRAALITVAQHVDQFLGGLVSWLSALPASPLTPVTDFLAGALQLLRRALTPVVNAVRGTTVTVVNRTTDKLSLRPRNCEDSTCETILEPGQSDTFSGYNESGFDVAVRMLTVRWLDFEDDDYPERGKWVGDELRMIVYATNDWQEDPKLLVYANPYAPRRDRPDELVNTAYSARKYEDSRFNPWKWLKEGQGCSCDAATSGGPLNGGQQVYIGRDKDSDDYKNWTVEVFALPTTETAEYRAETNDKRIARTYYCDGKGANNWD